MTYTWLWSNVNEILPGTYGPATVEVDFQTLAPYLIPVDVNGYHQSIDPKGIRCRAPGCDLIYNVAPATIQVKITLISAKGTDLKKEEFWDFVISEYVEVKFETVPVNTFSPMIGVESGYNSPILIAGSYPIDVTGAKPACTLPAAYAAYLSCNISPHNDSHLIRIWFNDSADSPAYANIMTATTVSTPLKITFNLYDTNA